MIKIEITDIRLKPAKHQERDKIAVAVATLEFDYSIVVKNIKLVMDPETFKYDLIYPKNRFGKGAECGYYSVFYIKNDEYRGYVLNTIVDAYNNAIKEIDE